ncbi:MAG: hypothetical protein OXH52_05240 [Gammaproteobacteria bacterium]|nr:hypothetical protein [Gammaproteobacteria bacterium]
MDYDEVSTLARTLGYRDKLRLAQLLVQLALRDEEEEHPEQRGATESSEWNPELVAQRIRKLRPKTRTSLLNSIETMYQFRGGISEEDKKWLVQELDRGYGISIDPKNRVSYSD